MVVSMNFFRLVVCSSFITFVYGSPFKATDAFVSPCPFLPDTLSTGLLSSPPKGFMLWSQASTWPDGIIPGYGSALGVNVTIPCGTAVLLDVPLVTLSLLRVQGLLRFLDSPTLPNITVRANFILVEGQLTIGTPANQFRQKATIELTPNTRGGRRTLQFTSFPPADTSNPRDLGHKAFAVVGGQVHLHGLPGSPSMPVWVRLKRTALRNDISILVDQNVAGSWPVGGEIVVTSTDYDRKQAEVFTIVKVTGDGSTSTIQLDSRLKYMHYGLPRSLPDGHGGFVEQRAEVALLSRNVVISGSREAPPYHLEGGHLMVFMTPAPQFVEGVRFLNMGQQGRLGRYPLHFHVNGNSPNSVCRKNAIQQSNQRCIVVHACHNMTVEGNVAFDTRGHCFILEEGGEMDNTFSGNLGILTEPVKVAISSDETDVSPATFWMSNPKNNLIGNVASGSSDSGFWIELRSNVRGVSLQIPSLKDIAPIHLPLGDFRNNVAHSNDIAGFRTYPHGIRPRRSNTWEGEGIPGTISGLNLYKNGWMGMFVHNTDYLTITSSVFADNYWGVFLHQDNKVSLTESRVVSLSGNLGNPDGCDRGDPWTSCRPTKGCTMPLPSGVSGRSTGSAIWKAPNFGVLLDVDSRFQSDFDSNKPNTIRNTLFSFFDSSCWNSAAIALVNNGEGEYWNSAHNIEGLKFTSDSNPIWSPPRKFSFTPWGDVSDGLEASQFYNLWDKDGSIMGASGYIIQNNSNLLPPSPHGCKAKVAANAYFCPGTCYRTVQVKYPEPGFKVGSSNSKTFEKAFSYLQVTRNADKKSFQVYGNFKQTAEVYGEPLNQRFFAFSLLAGQKYSVKFVPGTGSPNFFPANISVGYLDFAGCGKGLSLLFEPQTNKVWKGSASNDAFFKQCPGSEPLPATAQHSPVCVNNKQWTEVVLGTEVYNLVALTQTSSPTACVDEYECSLLWSGQPGWQYDATGLERRPQFYNPLSSTSSWSLGVAPMGYYQWDSETVKTNLPPPMSSRLAYYFRKSFLVKNTACITSLRMHVILSDGVILYLNNREILRSNMPAGSITNSTLALSSFNTFPYWKTFTLDIPAAKNSFYLVEGINYIAAEQHVAGEWQDATSFDIQISALTKGDKCTGVFKTSEVCDGVDNDNDGTVDKNASGKPLTASCSTSCGSGTATCISGFFQNCTAPPSKPEVCNGLDDDCDGLIDNGDEQLNCGKGKVCSQGRCLLVTRIADSLQIWPRNSSGWFYYDQGGNLDSLNPEWKTGNKVQSWKQGTGPLGFDNTLPARAWNKLGTKLNVFTKDGVSGTAYFAKSFVLSQQQIDNTYSITFKLRRVDGAVVYLNGKELWRSNMPAGQVKYNTFALTGMDDKEWEPGSNCCNLEWLYYNCDECTHKSTIPLRAGTNWISAEVHVAWAWKDVMTFDMDLTRQFYRKCSSLPQSPSLCSRSVHQFIFPLSTDGWQYNDASSPVPLKIWRDPSFNARSWKTGKAPFGYGKDLGWLLNTNLNVGPDKKNIRRTYYFRKSFLVTDANCYYQINSTLLSKDGAVVYFNGVEAYRRNLPTIEPIDSNTFAQKDGDWDYHSTLISGGWMKKGTNLVLVELHRYEENNDYLFFDLQLEGNREGVTCSPAPL